jgi:hypothetical protein
MCNRPLKHRGSGRLCDKCYHEKKYGKKAKAKAKEEKIKKLLGGKK